VTDTDGNPLAGANLDVWQADASGAYSGFMPGPPEGDMRGQVRTRDDGRCEFRTVIPGPARSRCEVVQTPEVEAACDEVQFGSTKPFVACNERHPEQQTETSVYVAAYVAGVPRIRSPRDAARPLDAGRAPRSYAHPALFSDRSCAPRLVSALLTLASSQPSPC